MRKRLIGCGIAGALWLLAGGATTALALGQDPAERERLARQLETELQQVEGRIADADRLLQRLNSEGGYLVANGMDLSVMSRDHLIEWATEQIFVEGSGAAADQAEVLRTVQVMVAGSRGLIATLHAARGGARMRRDRLRQDLSLLRPDGVASGAVATAACGFPHSWGIRMANGSTTLSVDASGSVSGSGIANGRATLDGNQLTLAWTAQATGGELAGRYIVALDAECSGRGELVLDRVPPGATELGIRGGPALFTSRGRIPPS